MATPQSDQDKGYTALQNNVDIVTHHEASGQDEGCPAGPAPLKLHVDSTSVKRKISSLDDDIVTKNKKIALMNIALQEKIDQLESIYRGVDFVGPEFYTLSCDNVDPLIGEEEVLLVDPWPALDPATLWSFLSSVAEEGLSP